MVAHPVIRFKAEDIWDTPEDGRRYEVIAGGLYVTPPPNWGHQYASDTLFGHLWSHVHARGLGKIVTAPVGVVLDDENGLQPDLVYIAHERLGIVTERGVYGTPDLIVEVLSRSTQARDRGVKMRRYAAAGVPHYWLLDYRRRRLQTYRLGAQGYESTGSYGPGNVFRPELCPGLEIPLDDLWA
jgi:Uma2 family endonuclease